MFERFKTKLAPVERYAAVPEAVIAKYTGRLPDALLTHWREDGWCSFGNGLLAMVDPALFTELDMPLVPEGEEVIVFMRGHMGTLFTWNGSEIHINDMIRGERHDLYDNIEDAFDVILTRDGWLDAILDRDIFLEALPRLGPPGPGECYGYFPPIALGGSGTPDTLKRVQLLEHNEILAQL